MTATLQQHRADRARAFIRANERRLRAEFWARKEQDRLDPRGGYR